MSLTVNFYVLYIRYKFKSLHIKYFTLNLNHRNCVSKKLL